jgi:hypothetical protein
MNNTQLKDLIALTEKENTFEIELHDGVTLDIDTGETDVSISKTGIHVNPPIAHVSIFPYSTIKRLDGRDFKYLSKNNP